MEGHYALQALVMEEVLLRKTRLLPCDGKVLPKLGDAVRPGDVVALAQRPAQPIICMVGETLGVPTKDLTRMLRRWAGEQVEKDEVLAEKKGMLGVGQRVCRSPVSGVVISGPHAAGEVVIAPPDEELVLRAGLPGRVVTIIPSRGVTVETMASCVQGVGGYGGEAQGVLRPVVEHPAGEIDVSAITDQHAGAVLVGGSIGEAALAKASAVGVAGVVIGGLSGMTYRWLEANNPPLTVVITDGAGERSMAPATFGLLQKRAGMQALIDGAAGRDRAPQVIVGLPAPARGIEPSRLTMAIGTRARLIAGAATGCCGQIAAIPRLPRRLPSGITTLVLEIALDSGEIVTAARDNVVLVS